MLNVDLDWSPGSLLALKPHPALSPEPLKLELRPDLSATSVSKVLAGLGTWALSMVLVGTVATQVLVPVVVPGPSRLVGIL